MKETVGITMHSGVVNNGIKVLKIVAAGEEMAKKNPTARLGLKKIGDDILSHKNCSTICASGLNDSVRKGKR